MWKIGHSGNQQGSPLLKPTAGFALNQANFPLPYSLHSFHACDGALS